MNPSIGRIVWVNDPSHSDQLCAAIVTYIHSPQCVNLTLFDSNGDTHPKSSHTFYHGDDGKIPLYQCGWMPYQVNVATGPKFEQSHLDRIRKLEEALFQLAAKAAPPTGVKAAQEVPKRP